MTIKSKYLKSAVFGASDGIITTFAIVAGVMGAGLAVEIILILGLANMVADGISMAVGDFLGERSKYKMDKDQGKRVSDKGLWKTSLVTFVSFVLAGSLPLSPYIFMIFGAGLWPDIDFSQDQQFQLSILATGGAMFFVGSLRTFLTKGKWWKNGLEMLLIGGVAAVAAYLVGFLVKGYLG
jgi:vacuolar iron transporter family protein